MTEYEITLDDATEPVHVVRYTVTIEWDGKSQELVAIETAYDICNSSYKFDYIEDAKYVADELNMDLDELMDECLRIIAKNS